MNLKIYINKATIILLFFITVNISGCYENENDGDSNIIDNSNYESLFIANDSTPEDYVIDQYTLGDVYMEEDFIHIHVVYAGGCEVHKFEFVKYGYFLESYPIQADLLLTHNANNDHCEALISEELVFNLTPLKEEYKSVYQTEEGEIIIRIRDLLKANGYTAVKYTF